MLRAHGCAGAVSQQKKSLASLDKRFSFGAKPDLNAGWALIQKLFVKFNDLPNSFLRI